MYFYQNLSGPTYSKRLSKSYLIFAVGLKIWESIHWV